MNAGVDKLGFNKLGGGVLLAGWIVILVVLLVLVSILHGAYGVRPEHALPMATNKQSSLPWSAWECRLEQLWRFARLLCAPTFKPPPPAPFWPFAGGTDQLRGCQGAALGGSVLADGFNHLWWWPGKWPRAMGR